MVMLLDVMYICICDFSVFFGVYVARILDFCPIASF